MFVGILSIYHKTKALVYHSLQWHAILQNNYHLSEETRVSPRMALHHLCVSADGALSSSRGCWIWPCDTLRFWRRCGSALTQHRSQHITSHQQLQQPPDSASGNSEHAVESPSTPHNSEQLSRNTPQKRQKISRFQQPVWSFNDG